jgi:malectin (di-glucose binding ER protein)
LVVFLFAAQAAYAQRVNSGGGNYTDSLGNVWAADNSFSGGAAFPTSATISGTSDPTLYRTLRYNTSSFSYSFPVPNGTYSVTLKFAEIWSGGMCIGCRVFNVSIEGAQVLSNFDVYSQVGANAALDKTFNVTVSDSTLDILFTPVHSSAEVNAVQVLGIP